MVAVELTALSDSPETGETYCPKRRARVRAGLIEALMQQLESDRYADLRRSSCQHEMRRLPERVTVERTGSDVGDT